MFGLERLRAGTRTVPVIRARVLPGRKEGDAPHEAALMGGEWHPDERIWSFPATSAFELRGGVMRLRLAGFLPLELVYGDRLEAIWVDYEAGTRVMSWRPVD